MLLVGVPDLELDRWLLELEERELLELPLGACGSAATEPSTLRAASETAVCLHIQASMFVSGSG